MTSIFDRYDGEFVNITTQIRSNIASGESMGLTSGLLKQANDLLKQMNIEARSSGDTDSKEKIKTYKKTIKSLQEDFDQAKNKADRSDLFGGAGGENDGRDRMMNMNSQLDRQNDTLDNARRVMAETEDVAMEITDELGRNREKIQSSRNKVLEVSSMTNQARRLVQSMSKREMQQKIMMYGLALVLVGAIIVVVYYMGKGGDDGGNTEVGGGGTDGNDDGNRRFLLRGGR